MNLILVYFFSFLIAAAYGVESVVITDTIGGRVCLECLFSSFTTETGCTVKLVSSSSVQFTETIKRNGSHTEGCIEAQACTICMYIVKVAMQWHK